MHVGDCRALEIGNHRMLQPERGAGPCLAQRHVGRNGLAIERTLGPTHVATSPRMRAFRRLPGFGKERDSIEDVEQPFRWSMETFGLGEDRVHLPQPKRGFGIRPVGSSGRMLPGREDSVWQRE